MKVILIYLAFLAVLLTYFITTCNGDKPAGPETWQVVDTVFVSNGVDTLRLDVSKLRQDEN